MDAVKTGAYLASLRKLHGMTQQETADYLHLSNKTISKWESGSGLPDITVLPALAELYGVTADEILAGESLAELHTQSQKSEIEEKQKYLLRRGRVRLEVCLILSAVCAIAHSFAASSEISYFAGLFCPALILIGWFLMRAATGGGEQLNRKPLSILAARCTLPILLIWEWNFRSFIWKYELSHSTSGFTPGQSLRIMRWNGLVWAVLAVATVILLQLLLWILEGRDTFLLYPWQFIISVAALLEFGLGYALWQTELMLNSDAVTREVLRELREEQYGAAVPALKISMWVLGILSVILIVFLQIRKRRSARRKSVLNQG